MTQRLSTWSIRNLPEEITLPGYNRSVVKQGIVHLGIGAFHRAHQAVYLDDLLHQGEHDWGIVGVSLRSSHVRDQLNVQDGLYSLVERDGAGDRIRIVGSVSNVLVAPENPSAVIDAMANPSIRIISMTITEKGYCLDPAIGELSSEHADIVHDLANPDRPKSAIGYIVAALRQRKFYGAGEVTLLSCDNVPHNGLLLRNVVHKFASLADPKLTAWIDANVTFPSTMVDRIVPATTADDLKFLAKKLGVDDQGMVKAEPFSQWVIEDDFAAGRPSFECVGVRMVGDVRPFELAKLRMLNGSHSALAYIGLSRGYQTVDQAIADPVIASIISRLMLDAAASLPEIPGFDSRQYAYDLISRFENKALAHKLEQIAMDGSQKLPQRLVQVIAENHNSGREAVAAATGIAAWMRHLTGPHVNDPMAGELVLLAKKAANDNNRRVELLADVRAVFGETGQAEWFRQLIKKADAALSTLSA